MSKRPAGILYGVDERPPWGLTLVMAVQHCLLMSSPLMLPVVIVQEIGGSMTQAAAVVGMSMIAAGIGTLLQTINKGPIGSGYLCPNLCGPSYLAVSVQAAWLGGLPLMHGMIMLAGVFEALLSRVIGHLRFLFPNTVTGVVVLMVGVAIVPLATSKFLGIEIAGDPVDPLNTGIASLTLLVLIGLNLWTKSRLRLYNVLIGMGLAYLLSSLAGILDQNDWEQVWQAPWLALPGQGIELFHFAFDWSLVLPFLIVSLCASLKSVGNLITCQSINDADWHQADMKNVGKGLFADSVAVFSGGFLGGVAVDTSSSNVGLSAASGVTSRWVGVIAGSLFIVWAFCPKLTMLVSIMPPAAMGAILLYVTSFMVAAGLKILLSAPMTTRNTFVVGIALIFGLSVDILPEMYAQLHPLLKPVFSSSLTLATVLAIVLHQIFRIGAKHEG